MKPYVWTDRPSSHTKSETAIILGFRVYVWENLGSWHINWGKQEIAGGEAGNLETAKEHALFWIMACKLTGEELTAATAKRKEAEDNEQ